MPVRPGDFAVWINHKDEPELVVAKTVSPSGKSMIVRREDGAERIAEPKKVLTLRQASNRGIQIAGLVQKPVKSSERLANEMREVMAQIDQLEP
jgi:hypothetical protein